MTAQRDPFRHACAGTTCSTLSSGCIGANTEKEEIKLSIEEIFNRLQTHGLKQYYSWAEHAKLTQRAQQA